MSYSRKVQREVLEYVSRADSKFCTNCRFH